nr:hypothetical protein [Blattabacterium cuenoti]
MELAMLKLYGGKINLLVHPKKGFKFLLEETELSIALMEEVPTEQIRFFFFIA